MATIVQEYQATDAEGNPIGRLTHLEAETPEEMYDKMKAAHIQATQALARQNKAFNDLKNRKATPIAPPKPAMTQEEQGQYAATISSNAAPASEKVEAIRKLGGITELEDRLQAAEAERLRAKGMQIALEFQRNHLSDYFACEANSKTITDFLNENNYEFTLDNLEIAFASVGDNLAKDPRWSAANNPTIADENTTPSSETQRRPSSFGMQPGTGSQATRPANNGQNVGKMTKKDVLAKKKADPAWWKKVLKDPNLQKEVNAALART